MGKLIDLTGNVYGKLTVIEKIYVGNNKKLKWRCKCECGNEYNVFGELLRNGITTMCKSCSAKIGGMKLSPDLTGKIYGELTVIRRATKEEKPKGQYWLCRCSCGNEIFTNASNLNNGHTYRCYDCGQKDSIKHRRIDLTGNKYGNLTVLQTLYASDNDIKYTTCKCICDCGNTVDILYSNLIKGNTTSCGCMRKEIVSEKLRKSILNQRFYSLVVTKEFYYMDTNKIPRVECVCDCGNIVNITKASVLYGHSTSCGCKKSSSLERDVEDILNSYNLNFEREYTFSDCVYINRLKFDFALLDDHQNVIQLIETDGEQHYKSVDFFGGEENFKLTQLRDEIKNEYCKSHNIPLLRLPYYLSKEEMETKIKNLI